MRGMRGASGTLIVDGDALAIESVKIEPPATVRQMEIHVDGGPVVRGQTVASYQYEIPIFHMTRPGSLVTADLDGRPVSGCINDLVFGDLTFDHLSI